MCEERILDFLGELLCFLRNEFFDDYFNDGFVCYDWFMNDISYFHLNNIASFALWSRNHDSIGLLGIDDEWDQIELIPIMRLSL